MEKFKLPPFLPNVEIAIGYFNHVTNTKELKQKVADGQLHFSLIKGSMIAGTFQVLAAAGKAFLRESDDKLVTRNIFSEVLFCLSPSNKISECFKLFGVEDSESNIVIVCRGSDAEVVSKSVQGEQGSLSNIGLSCDKDFITSVYKLTDAELNISSFVDCIVSQMISRELK